MELPYDPVLTREVIVSINVAIQASVTDKGAPALLPLPFDGIPLEQLFFVMGWKTKIVPSEELGLAAGLLAFIGWPDGVDGTTPTWALIVQVN